MQEKTTGMATNSVFNSGLMSSAKDANMSDHFKYSLVMSFKDFRGFKYI
jgi:hypothetical protein